MHALQMKLSVIHLVRSWPRAGLRAHELVQRSVSPSLTARILAAAGWLHGQELWRAMRLMTSWRDGFGRAGGFVGSRRWPQADAQRGEYAVCRPPWRTRCSRYALMATAHNPVGESTKGETHTLAGSGSRIGSLTGIDDGLWRRRSRVCRLLRGQTDIIKYERGKQGNVLRAGESD